MEIAQGRQVAQRLQVEELEELDGRAVQQRTPRLLLLAHDLDQLALEQDLEHRAAVDAAHVIDLRARHGLAVGDDRQGLELRTAEPRGLGLKQLLNPLRVVWVRAELEAAGDLPQHDPLRIHVDLQLLERELDLILRRVVEDLAQVLDRQRLARGEQQALDDRHQPR